MTGDWCGHRGSLRDCGLTIDFSNTNFYQGVARGGLDRSFPFGGRNDLFAKLDGEQAGLRKGFYIDLHAEQRYGVGANFKSGALSPVNEYLLVPAPEGFVTGLTALKLTQFLNEETLVFAGKINLLDEIHQPLTNAAGLDGFWNTSLIFNSILARTLTYSAFGAGIMRVKDGHPVFALSVFDTRDAADTSVFDDLFGNGAVIFGTYFLATNFRGLPGHQGIEGAYSSGSYTNIQGSPYLDPLEGLVIPSERKRGSWAIGYLFDQALWVSPDNPKKVWGVFGRLGIADDNPNPIRWTAMAGISGTSPIRGRSNDTFGIGYFRLGISNTLKQSAFPITPLRDEQGVEIYYNARITPWCQVTPDLQIVEPLQQRANTAVLFGLRARVDF